MPSKVGSASACARLRTAKAAAGSQRGITIDTYRSVRLQPDPVKIRSRVSTPFSPPSITTSSGWAWSAPRACCRNRGLRQGKAAVAKFFEQVNETTSFQQFEPREYVAQGDTVVALGHYRA